MTFLPLENLPDISFFEALKTSGFGFGIVLTVLAVLAIFVIILSKIINVGKKEKEESDEASSTVEATTPSAPVDTPAAEEKAEEDGIPHIPGFVVLDGVSEQDAAVLMAITAHKTGIDLGRLDFKSIKRLNQDPVLENIEEQDAAAIMAITSDKTGIPLDRLIFNSIKLVED